MCAICGVLNRQHKNRTETVSKMCAEMVYRGPDDSGVAQLPGCCLGHQRLSIVDLSVSAHQPMKNEDGSIWIIFNGEIYGYQDLAQELRQQGHIFNSVSDTEVILHGYESWGIVELCKRLTGMFAFGIWDQRNETLHLARDRFGEKPLFYINCGDEFRFSSNPKTLFIDSNIMPEVDLDGLVAYLHLGCCLPQFPILKNVKSVLPGTCISINNNYEEVIRRYWQLPFAHQGSHSPDEWLDQVEQALKSSVSKQLIADVPVGCLLSGGVDSSLISSIAAEIKPDLKLFTVRMPNSTLDESEKAKVVAKRVGGQHHIINAQPVTLDEFLSFQRSFGQPLGDASSIAVWMIAKYSKEYVKVLLTGDGGDELFAGYDRVEINLKLEKYRRIFSNLPGRISLQLIEKTLQPFTRHQFIRKAVTFSSLARGTFRDMFVNRTSLPENMQPLLWGPVIQQAAKERRYQTNLLNVWEDTDASDPLNKLLNFDIQTKLPGDYLTKVDTATMASSMESRAPFLDHQLAELAFTIPADMKRYGNTSKGLLKALLKRRVGQSANQSIAHKQGFVIPIDKWLDNEWKPLLDGLLQSPLISQGILTQQGIMHILARRKSQPARYTGLCYSLVVLDLWMRNLVTY